MIFRDKISILNIFNDKFIKKKKKKKNTFSDDILL